MQKAPLLTFLLLSAPLTGVLAADGDAPTIYGKFNLGLLNDETTDGRAWSVENQASRLGIKGDIKLENNLSLIYQYEAGIDPSDNSKPILSQRNSFIGLNSNYGQLKLGTFDTPLKLAQGKVDLFNDTSFDMSMLLSGEVRHKQSAQYSTPKLFGAITAHVDWLPAADAEVDDGLSASINLQKQHFAVAIAVDSKVAGDGGIVTTKDNPLNTVRAVFNFQPTSNLKLGLLAQQSKGIEADKSKEYGWLASVSWQINKLTLKGQIGRGEAQSDATGSSSQASLSQATVGLDYKMGKNTTSYIYTGLARYEDGAGASTFGSSDNKANTGFGLSYSF